MYYICCHCAGDVTIPDEMTFNEDSDLNGDSSQFTLTCTSTGGPATTVTWTRDSQTVSGGRTVLDNTVTAQYTHTLTVTGRLGGQYQCTVNNNKPSEATTTFNVQGGATMPNLLHLLLLFLLLLLLFPSFSSSSSSSCLSSHWPHCSPGRSH